MFKKFIGLIVVGLLVCVVPACSNNQDAKNDPVGVIMGNAGDREDDREIFDNAVYHKKATYPSYGVRNGRMAWRIKYPGGSYGRNLLIVFSDGSKYKVPNTRQNYRPGDGMVFKPGYKSRFTDKERDTSTSHGGVYLQAKYGSRARHVTFYW